MRGLVAVLLLAGALSAQGDDPRAQLAVYERAAAAHLASGNLLEAARAEFRAAECHEKLHAYAEAAALFARAARRFDELNTPREAIASRQMLARALRKGGKLQEARDVLQALLPEVREEYGARSDVEAHCEREIGDTWLLSGEPKKALAQYDKMLAHFEGTDSIGERFAHQRRSQALRDLGRLGPSVDAARRAYEVARRARPGTVEAERVRWPLAEALVAASKYDEAAPHVAAVLKIVRGSDRAQLLLLQARIRRLQGDHEAAYASAETALWLCERLFKNPHRLTAASLGELSRCSYVIGKYEHALRYAEAEAGMLRRILPGDHPLHIGAMQHLVEAHGNLGNRFEARMVAERALAMARRLHAGDHPEVVRALTGLGTALLSLGRIKDSLRHNETALAMARRVFPKGHIQTARIAVEVAHCETYLGRPERAIPLLRESLAVEDLPSARHRLSLALAWSGRNDEAFREIEIAIGMLSREHPYMPLLLRMRAMCRDRKSPAARKDAEDAVALARRHRDPYLPRYLETLATFSEDPIPILEEGIALAEERRVLTATLPAAESAYAFAAGSATLYHRMTRAQWDAGRRGEAVRYIEKRYGRAWLDLLERGRFDPLEEVERQVRLAGDGPLLARVRDTRARLAKLDADVARQRSKDRHKLVKLRRERDAVLRERALLIRRHAPLGAPASTEDVRGGLGKDELLIYIDQNEWNGWLYLVPPLGREIERHELRGVGYRTSLRDVDAFVAALTFTRGDGRGLTPVTPRRGDAATLGKEIFKRMFPPAAWETIRRAKLVSIVPYGDLGRIPFEALVVDEKGNTWLDVGPPIRYGTSGTMFQWAARRHARQRTMKPKHRIVVAAGCEYEKLPALPGTLREAEAIRAAFGKDEVAVISGAGATKERLRDVAPRGRYLHIATHATTRDHEVGLVLSSGGRVGVRDLLDTWRDRLGACELVVLSACETMTGPRMAGDAPYALPVGFMYAGAPAVIASLWRVDDASTAKLFTAFYKRLAKGEGKLAAFTAARKELKKTHPDPYHWAPFVFIGDPR